MNQNRITINSIESSLASIFSIDEWTSLQHDAYTIIRHYVDNYEKNNKKYEIKDDKLIIRNNFKDQIWFNYSKAKPMIAHLLDSMTLIDYIFDNNLNSLNFQVLISFDRFSLHACLYKNTENGCLNFYIFFQNKQKQRAYMAYYTESMVMNTKEDIKTLRLPEFEKIYQVIEIDSEIFYQYDLLNFFSEIIMYYDESGSVGDQKISPGVPVTLNQLINKFNNYVFQKNQENDHK